MAQTIQGTFAYRNASSTARNQVSDTLVIPTGVTSMRLSTVGCNGSNTLRTERSTDNGATWAAQTTYNSEQTLASISVTENDQWRIASVVQQALRDLQYRLSVES